MPIRRYTAEELKLEHDFAESIRTFGSYMFSKLCNNAHKGGWQSCDMEYLTKRLQEELIEIQEAIKNKRPASEVRNECADVANFAMMISENYMRNQLEEKVAAMHGNPFYEGR